MFVTEISIQNACHSASFVLNAGIIHGRLVLDVSLTPSHELYTHAMRDTTMNFRLPIFGLVQGPTLFIGLYQLLNPEIVDLQQGSEGAPKTPFLKPTSNSYLSVAWIIEPKTNPNSCAFF